MATKSSKTKGTTLASIALPKLGKNEINAGLILENGKPKHWLILLQGEMASGHFADAQAFAKKACGDLPTREEQSLLYANCKGEFQGAWYWSGVKHATHSGYAWVQVFGNGYQNYSHQGGYSRARAVRRVVI
jgi:hypothetical protein